MIYIQRHTNQPLETVGDFETVKEARAKLKEYRLADSSAQYYLSNRACKEWRTK